MSGSAPDPATPERLLGEDGGRAYRHFLDWTVDAGFSLAVIELTEPRRRTELLEWTRAKLPGTREAPMREASGKPLREVLDRACAPPGEVAVLVLTGLDEAVDRTTLFRRLNIPRDELVRDFAVPWVILIHPAAALELTIHAPDLSDFAGLWLREERAPERVRFTEQAAAEALATGAAYDPRLRRAEEALRRSLVDEGKDLLAQYDMRMPEARARDPYRLRLEALLSEKQGRRDDALAAYEAAFQRCEETGDERLGALVIAEMAELRGRRGEAEGALGLLRRARGVLERVARGRSEDRAIAEALLRQALTAAEAMRIPEAETIRDVMRAHGFEP